MIMSDTGYTLRLPERAYFAELTANDRNLGEALDEWLASNPDDDALQHIYGCLEATERGVAQ